MSTQTAPAPAATVPAADDDLCHLYCECNIDLSLCGLDISDATRNPDPDESRECIVCNDLDDTEPICRECGA